MTTTRLVAEAAAGDANLPLSSKVDAANNLTEVPVSVAFFRLF